MRTTTLRTLGLFAALLVLVKAARAQEITQRRPFAAAGMDMVLFEGDTFTPSIFGMGGLAWQHPTSRNGRRVYATFNHRSRTNDDGFLFGCEGQCRSETRSISGGLGLESTIDLTRGRIRPYLLSGASLFRTWSSVRRNYVCNDGGGAPNCAIVAGGGPTYRFSGAGLGLHAGGGFAIRWGSRTLTLESRFEIRTIGDGGPNSEQAALPLLLGIRF